MAEADWLLELGKSTPPVMLERHETNLTSTVRTLIRNSIADDGRNKLSINALTGHPAAMVRAVNALFNNSKDSMHRRLENYAKEFTLKHGQRIAEYVAAHRVPLLKIHKAAFPSIKVEVTDALYIVAGLTGNPKFRDASRTLQLTSLPTSITGLHNRLTEEDTTTYDKNMAFASHTTPAGSSRNRQGSGRARWRGIRNAKIKSGLQKIFTDFLKKEMESIKGTIKKYSKNEKGRASAANTMDRNPDSGQYI